MKESGVGDASRFRELEGQFLQSAQGRMRGYWEDRDIGTSAHPDCLAVSWSGTQEYWIAVDWHARCRDAEKKLERDERLTWRERRIIAARTRDEYDPRSRHKGFAEAFLFFKDSSRLPETLQDLAPDMEHAYRQAPLHHWFVIGRDQPPSGGRGGGYTEFRELVRPERDVDTALRKLLDLIFPERCPGHERWSDPRSGRERGLVPFGWTPGRGPDDRPGRRERDWEYGSGRPPAGAMGVPAAVTVLIVVISLIVLLAFPPTRYMMRQAWANFLQLVQGGGPVLPTGQPPVLNALYDEYYYLQEQRAALTIVTVSEDASHVRDIDRRLAEIASEIRRLGGRLPDDWAEQGPRLPPCLPVAWSGGEMSPGYVYIVTVRNEGISVVAPGQSAIYTDERFDGARPVTRGGMDIASFERHVRPISTEAYRWGCKHFVLLRNDEWIDPGRYTELRDAVSRHFYIHRPPRR